MVYEEKREKIADSQDNSEDGSIDGRGKREE